MFITNAWYVVAWAIDIGATPFARTVLGEPIVFYRDSSGAIVGLEDRCCHRGLPLSLGAVEGDRLVCGYHGAVFDRAGCCVAIPGQERIPATMKIRGYPVVEKDELVWVWMGPPEQADPKDIFSYPFHDGATPWPHRVHTQHIRCDWTLVIGNLMDLTHLAFVHKGTVGGDTDAHTSARFDVEPTSAGVRFARWLLNSMPPSLYIEGVPFKGRVDRWMQFEFIAPSTVTQFTGAVDASPKGTEISAIDQQGGFALRMFHHVTPETADSCFYFWSGGNGYRMNEPAVTEKLFKGLRDTFDEDEQVLEAQHASLKRRPTPIIPTVHDKAVHIAMRRIEAMHNHGDIQ